MDAFVARFLGFGNVFDVDVVHGKVETPWGPLDTGRPDGAATLVIRPDGCRFAGDGVTGVGGLAGEATFRGDHFLVTIHLDGGWRVEVVGENAEESPYVAMTSKLIGAFPRFGSFRIEPAIPFTAPCTIAMPADVMHSFQSPHNAVRWKLVVCGEAEAWPAFERGFPIVVNPGQATMHVDVARCPGARGALDSAPLPAGAGARA